MAIYLLSSITPALTSNNFYSAYDFVPAWVIWAILATAATVVSVWSPRWRVAAGAMAASYIFLRAVYVEWQFGARAPWSSFALSVALAMSIAWSWGRPPIKGHRVDFMPRGSR